jgi:hypothetical protein
MNEERFARQIKQALDSGLRLDAVQAERLRAARERALARVTSASVGTASSAGGTAVLGLGGGPAQALVRYVLPLAILAAALFGYSHWQEVQRTEEIAQQAAEVEEIDTAVLTGDPRPRLPRMAKTLAAVGLALCLSLLASLPVRAADRTNPSWNQLTAEQRRVLAPIESQWGNLDPVRKRKWIGVADRYPKLSPQEQQRLQKRMSEWAALTPEQRNAARERYREFEQLPPERRQAAREKWEQYQSSARGGPEVTSGPGGEDEPAVPAGATGLRP